jgi:NTE family protein
VYATPLRRIVEPDLRNSLSVSQRAFEIGMYYSSKRKFHQCDLLLCPTELSHFGTFDTKHFQEIMQVGYRAAQEQMETILQLLGESDEDPNSTHQES